MPEMLLQAVPPAWGLVTGATGAGTPQHSRDLKGVLPSVLMSQQNLPWGKKDTRQSKSLWGQLFS